ncbi:hypothetical protein [Paenibacillus silviterrae]|uniref:hypothetical protein n=1 Tax=Paenibacillus silviterrae TaxID=3242194 RepID=UPI0025429C84|nr:hypothetical protein [Paenibacillus chinjuensis]
MIRRAFSSNRWLSLLLIVVFMLFASPTPSLEVKPLETGKSSSSIGIDYFEAKSTTRPHVSTFDDSLEFAKATPLFSLLLCAMMSLLCRTLRSTHVPFEPLISNRLTGRFLFPIQRTSNYV